MLQSEIKEVTKEDCIKYIRDLVIRRTYDGYLTEIKTVYGKLEKELEELKVKIEAAPDEGDRLYNVDFYIRVGEKYIGLQIKPITYEDMPEAYQWKERLGATHQKFEQHFGGKVFVVFSIKEGSEKKSIQCRSHRGNKKRD